MPYWDLFSEQLEIIQMLEIKKKYIICNCPEQNSAYKANSKEKLYIHSKEYCIDITQSLSLFTITYKKM